jgi:hypothetical protein
MGEHRSWLAWRKPDYSPVISEQQKLRNWVEETIMEEGLVAFYFIRRQTSRPGCSAALPLAP